MARVKAPAGGTIVNGQFQGGGRFLPRALGRIRDVVARKAKKLARPTGSIEPALAHAENVHGPIGDGLTAAHLKEVEDFLRMEPKHRLSAKVTVGKDGYVTASNAQVAKFFKDAHKYQYATKDLRRELRHGTSSPEAKAVLLANHFVHDAERSPAGGKDWYTNEIRTFDTGLKKLMEQDGIPWSPAHHTLAKAVLAFTSGGQNPVLNTLATVRMIRAGAKRNPADPFSAIPEVNEDALAGWRAENADVPPPPKDRVELIRWAQKYGKGGRFKVMQAKAVNRPGHKDHGRLVATIESVADPETGRKKRQWTPLAGEETGRLINRHKKHLKDVNFPILSETGELQPPGWTNRNPQIVENLRKLKKVIAHHGGDLRAAADWLLSEHPRADIEKVTEVPPDGGYVLGDRLPGTFAFGPKFGPFALNLHIPDSPEHGKFLTADMWFARTWNRYIGTLFNRGEAVKAPRSDAERREMWDAAKLATKKLGLSSVAELQAVLWYYEQRLWRLFGAENKSYSYTHGIDAARKARTAGKLSRADTLREKYL